MTKQTNTDILTALNNASIEARNYSCWGGWVSAHDVKDHSSLTLSAIRSELRKAERTGLVDSLTRKVINEGRKNSRQSIRQAVFALTESGVAAIS